MRGITIGVLAHEFEHLINGSRHLYVTGTTAFEETFLDEGLAHVAEELTFYRASGLSHGQDITFAATQASQPVLNAFNSFGAANIRRFREFLRDPQASSPYAKTNDIAARGAIWSFLRYAADRRGADGTTLWHSSPTLPPGCAESPISMRHSDPTSHRGSGTGRQRTTQMISFRESSQTIPIRAGTIDPSYRHSMRLSFHCRFGN